MSDAFVGVRQSYDWGVLTKDNLPDQPWKLLSQWVTDALQAGNREPSAMNLATVSGSAPSSRMVILRGIDERGLTFYSHRTSRKGREMDENPHVACCLWWPETERQVRVEGVIEVLHAADAEAYFRGRPYDSQIATLASPQSEEIANREWLEAEVARLRALHPEEVPMPERWTGYFVRPSRWEFWQGRPARLHDRLLLEWQGVWQIKRLAP